MKLLLLVFMSEIKIDLGNYFTKILFFETAKSKVIISLFETVRLSVSISPRNLYNSLKSTKEIPFHSLKP